MPLYTYKNKESGAVVELMRCIEERDQVHGFERIVEYPRAVKVVNPSAGSSLDLQAQQVLGAYKKMEERGKFRSKFSARQIKDAFNRPPVPDPVASGAL